MYVVTEHGSSDIFLKILKYHIRLLIQLASPDFREELKEKICFTPLINEEDFEKLNSYNAENDQQFSIANKFDDKCKKTSCKFFMKSFYIKLNSHGIITFIYYRFEFISIGNLKYINCLQSQHFDERVVYGKRMSGNTSVYHSNYR